MLRGSWLFTPLSPVTHVICVSLIVDIVHAMPSNKTSAYVSSVPKPVPVKVIVSPPRSHPCMGLIFANVGVNAA